MKLNCGAKRHHYSMFDVGRSMFDVESFKTTLYGIIATCECLQNKLALMGFILARKGLWPFSIESSRKTADLRL